MNSFNFLYWFFFQLNDFLKGEFQSRLLLYKEKNLNVFKGSYTKTERDYNLHFILFFCVSHFPNIFHNITNKQKALKAFTSHTTLKTIVTHLIFCLLIITNKQSEIANDHATTVKLLIQWLGEALYLHFMLKGNK